MFVLYHIELKSFIFDTGFPRNSGSNGSLCRSQFYILVIIIIVSHDIKLKDHQTETVLGNENRALFQLLESPM